VSWIAINPVDNYPRYAEDIAFETTKACHFASKSVGTPTIPQPQKPSLCLPSVEAMCKELDDLAPLPEDPKNFEKTYNALYRILSGKSHGDFAAIHHGLNIQDRSIEHGPTIRKETASMYLAAPTSFLIGLIEKIMDVYGLPKDSELTRVADVFSKDFISHTVTKP
jgi:hypothetical protein